MTDKQAWFHAFLKFPYIALLAGLVLLLSSFGTVELGFLKFTPSADSPFDIRFFLASAGLILILLGTTLILNDEGIWRSRLGGIYFVTSLALLGGLGFLNYDRPANGPALSYQEMRLFNNWDVTDEQFYTQIAIQKLAPLKEENVLILMCRKNDPAVEFEADVRNQKSQRYEIRLEEPLQTMAVDFETEFSSSLTNGDLIECGLAAIRKSTQLDDIHAPSDVVGVGGEILGFASDDIGAARGDGPPIG